MFCPRLHHLCRRLAAKTLYIKNPVNNKFILEIIKTRLNNFIYRIMKQRRTSLKDLADHLGVSIATVSRALRNSHEVGEEMTKKVKDLAKQLNYRPNPFAQSLRKEAPRVIGVIVPNLVTHYYAAVLDGIEDYASKQGYSVISANSHEDHTREERALDNFLNMHVEGIIACLAQDTVDYSHFEQLHDMGIPLVFFARCCLENKFSQVVAMEMWLHRRPHIT